MGFEFSEKKHIEIRGKQYRLEVEDVNFMIAVNTYFPEITKKMQKIAGQKNVIAPYAQKLNDPTLSQEDKDNIVKEVEEIRLETYKEKLACMEDMKYFIQGCLVPGSYEAIFGGEPENFTDHYKLCAYIFNEAYKSRQDVIDEFMDTKPKANRAQRRNKKAVTKIAD